MLRAARPCTSVVLKNLAKLVSQRLFNLLELGQVKLAHLPLIGYRQLLVQPLRRFSSLPKRSVHVLDCLLFEHAVEVANSHAATVQPLQKLLNRLGGERALDRGLQFRELRFLLNLDDCLLESHCHSPLSSRGDVPFVAESPRRAARSVRTL